MRVVALVSGGKDSLFNLMKCVSYGHDVVALGNLYPKPSASDELDSYMYQTVGHNAIELYADAIGLPLYRQHICGFAKSTGSSYSATLDDEVEDLTMLLNKIKKELNFDAVSVGAVLSNYQRVRVEHVCSRLGLTCLSYLWRQDQRCLLQDMLSNGVNAILIKVAALGLNPSQHLGKDLSSMFSHLCSLEEKYGCHVCGEGGEYETLTLDCPLFLKRLELLETEIVIHSDDAFAPVGYLRCINMTLKDKGLEASKSLYERMKHLPMCTQTMNSNNIICQKNSPSALPDDDDDEFEEAVRMCTVDDSDLHVAPEIEVMSSDERFVCISRFSCPLETGSMLEECCLNAFKRLQGQLHDHASAAELVLMVYLYIADMSSYPVINSAYATCFGASPPARVTIESHLGDDVIFHLSCLALTKTAGPKSEPMHVQSISEWAPANIGPYSQSMVCDGLVFVSGCIGLVPATMQMCSTGMEDEARLALQHVIAIAQASKASSLHHAVVCFCYVSKRAHCKLVKRVWSLTAGSANCSVNCIVVSRLPRDANFEWHLIFAADDSSHSPSEASPRVDVISPSTSSSHSSSSTSLCLMQEHSLTSTVIARRLVSSLGSTMDARRCCYVHLIYNRKTLGISNETGLISTLQHSFKELHGCCPAVMILAADWLDDGDIVAAMCTHGSHGDGDNSS